MSTAEAIEEIAKLPGEKRVEVVRDMLGKLFPQSGQAIERMMRRIEHPEVPEDVWEGFEEAEDGKGIEMRDEHFENPPA